MGIKGHTIFELLAMQSFNIIMEVLDAESNLRSDFEILPEFRERNDGSVVISGCYTSDYYLETNRIEGYIESYDKVLVWHDFHAVLVNVGNAKATYNALYSEILKASEEFSKNNLKK